MEIAQHSQNSTTVTALSVIGLVLGVLGIVLGFTVLCAAWSFFLAIPGILISIIALIFAIKEKSKKTLAVVAITSNVVAIAIPLAILGVLSTPEGQEGFRKGLGN